MQMSCVDMRTMYWLTIASQELTARLGLAEMALRSGDGRLPGQERLSCADDGAPGKGVSATLPLVHGTPAPRSHSTPVALECL